MNPVQLWEAAKAAHPDHIHTLTSLRSSYAVDAAWARWESGDAWTVANVGRTWLLALVRDTDKQRHITIWERRKLVDAPLLVPVELHYDRLETPMRPRGDARWVTISSHLVHGTAADAAVALTQAIGVPVLQWPAPYDPRTAALDSARREVEDAELEERSARAVHEAAARRLDLAYARLRALESEGGAA